MNSEDMSDGAASHEGSAAARASPSAATQPACRLVLFGPPGSGKGTQAYLLGQYFGACHLSTGDVFRAAANKHTPAMIAAMEFMHRGALVPDATVWDLVREQTKCLHCSSGFLLDGFPRNLVQAELLDPYLREQNIPLTAVVDYELALDEVVSRLAGRRVCKKCRASFHITRQPPKVEDVCDHCGGTLYHRDDDRPESIVVRMQTYTSSTEPLIDYYRKKGLLVSVDASGSPEEICDRTMVALKQRTAAGFVA